LRRGIRWRVRVARPASDSQRGVGTFPRAAQRAWTAARMARKDRVGFAKSASAFAKPMQISAGFRQAFPRILLAVLSIFKDLQVPGARFEFPPNFLPVGAAATTLGVGARRGCSESLFFRISSLWLFENPYVMIFAWGGVPRWRLLPKAAVAKPLARCQHAQMKPLKISMLRSAPDSNGRCGRAPPVRCLRSRGENRAFDLWVRRAEGRTTGLR